MTFAADAIAAAVARGLAAARDQAHPADAGRAPEKYARLSRDFRASAWKHLREEGGLPQASDKAWGNKAWEWLRRPSRRSARSMAEPSTPIVRSGLALQELSRPVGASGDADTRRWLNNSFSVARTLHSNFYEDEQPAQEVADGLELCEVLSERPYRLFWPEGAEWAR